MFASLVSADIVTHPATFIPLLVGVISALFAAVSAVTSWRSAAATRHAAETARESMKIAKDSFERSAPTAELQRHQEACMIGVGSLALLLWEQILVVVQAQSCESAVDSYLEPAMRHNMSKLSKALDEALLAGLWADIVTSNKDGVLLFVAFKQSLDSEPTGPVQRWGLKAHLLMGTLRTMAICVDSKFLKDAGLRRALEESVEKRQDLREQTWEYLR